MNHRVTILAPRGRDAVVITQVLDRAGIASQACPDLPSLLPWLDDTSAVILTEESLAGEGLQLLLDWVERQPPWCDMPFIVLATRQAGVRSPAHRAVLEALGNAVLLERPLNAESLASAARTALRARRRQLALRDLTDTLETRVQERTHALAESEERFRATFEGFPEPLFVVKLGEDRRFIFESYNPAAERRTGVSAAAVRGQTALAIMPAAQACRLEAEFARCVETGAGIELSEEFEFPGGKGTFELTLTPMHDAGGQVTRLLGVARDVTERNRLEERLRSAQKLEAVGQLTGGVAHDFNNLLQVVLSGLTLMDAVKDPDRRTQVAESVRRAAQRGGELTKRLLTIARRQSLRPEAIDIGAWIRGGAAELLARTLRGDIEVDTRVPPGLPPVEVDAAELELAVLNLAVNSRDAMPEGGTVTLQAEEVEVDELTDPDGLSGRFVRLSVSDTGMGMSPEVQARVFEPFFTTKEIGKGTGLGLAQVYGFARQSGGGVRLRSAPGEGTTVSLLLPIAHNAAPAADPEPAEPERRTRHGASVLVCEDDDDVAALVVDMLTQLGHAPTRVTNAAAALGALADGRNVDLLFTDVMMPGGMDGLALAREASRRRPGLPVLLTTGYTGGPASEPIGVPLLRKPYRLDDLAAAVERALQAA
ncbi:MAG TPA: ATP-binding protein [Acetobacteraceae bacterium]|nr:ATP-binding protein [Acetobacteraceae bacterium]